MSQQPQDQLTIDHFKAGGLYRTGEVARFFRVTKPIIIAWIRDGKLAGVRMDAKSQFRITGDEVRRVWGTFLLSQDAQAATSPAAPKKVQLDPLDILAAMEAAEAAAKTKAKQKPKARKAVQR